METKLYPILTAQINKNPNKFYAIPILGMLVKFIMLIPPYIVLLVLSLVAALLTTINSFVVLFTGKYWKTAFDLNLGLMRYQTKLTFFSYGLTDKYPGFDLSIKDNYSLEMEYPKSSNRLFAIPLIGFVIRFILLIPFYIFEGIVAQAAGIGILFGAWAVVLFTGRYPVSMFEFGRDTTRLALAAMAYMAGLSDKYPSFSISWNHKNIKIALIVLSILITVFQLFSGMATPSDPSMAYPTPDSFSTLPTDTP